MKQYSFFAVFFEKLVGLTFACKHFEGVWCYKLYQRWGNRKIAKSQIMRFAISNRKVANFAICPEKKSDQIHCEHFLGLHFIHKT